MECFIEIAHKRIDKSSSRNKLICICAHIKKIVRDSYIIQEVIGYFQTSLRCLYLQQSRTAKVLSFEAITKYMPKWICIVSEAKEGK